MILFICLNMVIGAVALQDGHAVSVSSNCYFSGVNDISQFDNDAIQDMRDEMLIPTNMTSTGEGDGTPLDNFTQMVEIGQRQLEIALSFFTGGYVINSIANVTMGCSITCDQALVNGGCDIHNGANFVYTANNSSQMWQNFSMGLQGLVLVAMFVAIIHILRGSTPLNPNV